MSEFIVAKADKTTVPVHIVAAADAERWRANQSNRSQRWAEAHDFEGRKDQVLVVPAGDGGIQEVVLGAGEGLADAGDPWAFAKLAADLPAGTYRIAGHISDTAGYHAALGWSLEQYRFARYKAGDKVAGPRRLVVPRGVDLQRLERIVTGTALVRDLINTPTSDMGPAELEDAARDVAGRFGAALRTIEGAALLAENFPLIHAVGRASDRAPRLVDMTWGPAGAPRVTLVGKGVCFDTGGLDISRHRGCG